MSSVVAFMAGAYFWWDRREHRRLLTYSKEQFNVVDEKADLLFTKSDMVNRDVSEINISMASMRETIEWIKDYAGKADVKNDQISEAITIITEGLLDNDQIPRKK
ncbi:MAG: hypothetical protein KAS66_08105 [Candidatus Omnitrophica bacterium]|nr:hypothetical protein [Candidatus Omnitrophota bacterium]